MEEFKIQRTAIILLLTNAKVRNTCEQRKYLQSDYKVNV